MSDEYNESMFRTDMSCYLSRHRAIRINDWCEAETKANLGLVFFPRARQNPT